jgi:hypothetical protein
LSRDPNDFSEVQFYDLNLQAYDEGEDRLEELAEQFRVSLGWAKEISARRSRTGEVDAPVWRHGPVSRVTPAIQEWIRRQIRNQPDSAAGIARAAARDGASAVIRQNSTRPTFSLG